jgi:hypothetical protein
MGNLGKIGSKKTAFFLAQSRFLKKMGEKAQKKINSEKICQQIH